MEWKMCYWKDLIKLYKVTSNEQELDSKSFKMDKKDMVQKVQGGYVYTLRLNAPDQE